MKFADEFNMPSTEELRSPEAWSNVSPSILKIGRTTHIAPQGIDDEAKEAFLSE